LTRLQKGFLYILTCEHMVPAISDYRQSLQFRGLNDEKENIQLWVSILVAVGYYLYVKVCVAQVSLTSSESPGTNSFLATVLSDGVS
jgi:hypothetical protein